MRILTEVARSAWFEAGQAVEVSAQDFGVLIKPVGSPKQTLAQKLAAFDSFRHVGEITAAVAAGKEAPDAHSRIPVLV